LDLTNNKEFTTLLDPYPDGFSNSGNIFFFRMMQPLSNGVSTIEVAKVYSYLDGLFDLNASENPPYYTCSYNAVSGAYNRLEHENERIKKLSNDERKILIERVEGFNSQYYWSRKSLNKDYVLFLDSKDTVHIPTVFSGNEMSASGNFVIGSNHPLGDRYCTDVINNEVKNLTSNLPIPRFEDYAGETMLTKTGRSLSFIDFVNNDTHVTISDHYDLWMLSSKNDLNPINLTNGFGRKHHIVFRFVGNYVQLKKNDEVILSAFDENNKDAGFYKIIIGANKDPELLTMGRYTYREITKAKNANVWIVKRMSATDAPNYFWTSNFKTFQRISNVEPEKKYNWFTTKLIKYTAKNGGTYDAILYKPNNFDSTKKYPVLFNFYEQESYKLNWYLLPGYTSYFNFNFPLILNRGYLVCVPDIHFKLGETANSIVSCVEASADYLSKQPYADSAHFGACGGSFAGYGVNCLAAFSHRFKAVISISGMSDLVSAYGNIPGTREELYEYGQGRMGVSLPKDPEKYFLNSPIAFVKNVTTPVLIVITKFDGNVNIQQGIEFFISLRRAGKKAWLIRYLSDQSQHGVIEQNEQKDLYTRINQFFDHYLKGQPAPEWMTEGISTKETRLRTLTGYNPNKQNAPIGLPIDTI
jgi:dipeptidyl aminopeptidase/acylaminoacyl peptidase